MVYCINEKLWEILSVVKLFLEFFFVTSEKNDVKSLVNLSQPSRLGKK